MSLIARFDDADGFLFLMALDYLLHMAGDDGLDVVLAVRTDQELAAGAMAWFEPRGGSASDLEPAFARIRAALA